MHTYETLTYEKSEHIVLITLYRPAEANGLNTALASELALAAQACAEDRSVKAVIVTGQGKFFSAGWCLRFHQWRKLVSLLAGGSSLSRSRQNTRSCLYSRCGKMIPKRIGRQPAP